MKTVNIHTAKTHFSRILEEIENGETYIICRNGKPIADLVLHKERRRSIADPNLSQIRINYDPTEELIDHEWGEIE